MPVRVIEIQLCQRCGGTGQGPARCKVCPACLGDRVVRWERRKMWPAARDSVLRYILG